MSFLTEGRRKINTRIKHRNEKTRQQKPKVSVYMKYKERKTLFC